MFRAQNRKRRRGDARGRWSAALVVVVLASGAVLIGVSAGRAADVLAVDVSPAQAYLRPGTEVRFTAVVSGAEGEAVAADLAWSLIPPRLGWIEDDGTLLASDVPGRGIVRVVARSGGLSGSGHAAIEVGTEPPRRLSVVVTPPGAVAPLGGEVQFEAAVTDPASGAALDAELRWVVMPQAIGTVSDAGLFTAGADAGSGRVAARAAYEGREGVGDAGIVVGTPEHADLRVTVNPPRALLRPGDEIIFEAAVVNANGEPVQVAVEWSAVPRTLGVITDDGLFTAGPDEMDGRVVATVMTAGGPARGFAAVEVRRPGPAGLRVHIRPREAAVSPGGDVQFEAVVLGPDNEPLDVPVDWQVRPEWLGVITPDGFFTAAEEFSEPASTGGWRGAVTASVTTSEGTASDAARVFVRKTGQAVRLRILPPRPVVAPGEEVQFEAEVVGAGDPIGWTTEWAVFPPDLGTITPDGLFTANPAYGDPSSPEFGPHEGAVGARATLDDGTTLSDLAHVLVRIPGSPVRVLVEPRVAVVPPTESVQFEAVVLGPDGEPVDVPVTWGVAPARIGTITQDGLFTASEDAGEPGSWQRPTGRVTAEVVLGAGRVFRGAAVVVVDVPNPEIVVRVAPRDVTLRPGASQQFEAVVFQNGSPVSLPVEWRVVDPVVGTITPDGLFTATSLVPPGQTRQTRVVASVTHGGQVYGDAAVVRVTRGAGGTE